MGAFQIVNRSTHTNQLMKEIEFPMKITIWRTVPALALAALLTVAGSTQADLEEGLVGYWPLDGDFVDQEVSTEGNGLLEVHLDLSSNALRIVSNAPQGQRVQSPLPSK